MSTTEISTSYMISAYFVLSLYVIATLILFCIIAHLIQVSRKKKRNYSESSDALHTFVAISVAGIVSFAISCILVIAVIAQIIMIADCHCDHDDSEHHWLYNIYYQSFDEMEYLTAIFGTIGHLCVILLFIGRFVFTFRDGIFLTYTNRLIRCIYFVMFMLCMVSCVIILLIIVDHKSKLIIASEIVWQLLVEAMCLWMLYLFTSRLYLLLKMSLTDHIKSGKATDFFKELLRAVTHNISTARTVSHNPHSKETSRSNAVKHLASVTFVEKQSHPDLQISNRIQSNSTISIDGVVVQPIPSTLNLNHHLTSSLNVSSTVISTPHTVSNHSMEISAVPMRLSPVSNNSEEISNVPMTRLSPAQSIDLSITNELIEVSVTRGKERRFASETNETERPKTVKAPETDKTRPDLNEAVSLIVIMNKLTLLVLLMVFVSLFGVVGNVFIEIRELETINKHEIAIQSIWAEILPLFEKIVTSFVLYLQFNFTDNIYRSLLGKLDVLFLKCWLRILIQCWWKQNRVNDEKVISFLFDNALAKKTKKDVGDLKNPKQSP